MSRLDSEFLRRVIYVVVPFLWLLVHGLCLAFGEVTCVQVNPNQWICSGTGDGGEYPPIVVTNVVGVCTNCVSMSPSECETIKGQAIAHTIMLKQLINTTFGGLDSYTALIRDNVLSLKSEGDAFNPVQKYNIRPNDNNWNTQTSAAQFPYLISGELNEFTSFSYVSTAASCNNSIANYYYTAVQPVLDGVLSDLDELDERAIRMQSHTDFLLGNVFPSIDCDACTATFDNPTNSVPSGGGGGGGGSGGSCTNCVCKEQLEAILKVLKGKTTIVENDTREVESIASTVDRIKTSLESFKKYMKDIFEGHTHISITDGNWTNVYLTGHANGFNYNKSNVLERIELLLWSLTALNTPSNTNSYLDGKDINGIGDAIDEGLDSLKSDIGYATNNIAVFHSSLVRLVSALQPIGSSDGGFSRTLLGHTEFDLGDTHFDVPDLVADSDNLSDAQGFFDALRLSFQVLYLAGSAYCIWVFWVFALNKTLVFVKWAGEIMTAFFG